MKHGAEMVSTAGDALTYDDRQEMSPGIRPVRTLVAARSNVRYAGNGFASRSTENDRIACILCGRACTPATAELSVRS